MTRQDGIKEAVGVAKRARHTALCRKRDAGDPRDPFRAKAGRGAEFQEAAKNVRAYDLIIRSLEYEARRAAWKEGRSVRVRIAQAIDRLLDIAIGTGLLSLAALGFASAFALLRLPYPVIQAATVISVAVSLARAAVRK